MELSDRKKKILQVVVDDYIDDGQPVSSKLIHDKHLQDLSPATIRSELAQLEELGYLGQPHTSAGRVPLPAAYSSTSSSSGVQGSEPAGSGLYTESVY